jgi:hypothetical protein
MHALKEAGWVDRGRVASYEYQTKKQIYTAPDRSDLSKSDLRRMCEENPGALSSAGVKLKIV